MKSDCFAALSISPPSTAMYRERKEKDGREAHTVLTGTLKSVRAKKKKKKKEKTQKAR